MGSCCCLLKPRCFFLFLCYVQLLTLIARQTFDLFGHLWTCVLVNFVTILVVIIGIFGGHQRRPAYVLLYLTWQLLTIAWNAFLVCFYLEIGPYTLTNGGDFNLINLGTGSRSWFEANGHGCNASYNISDLSDYLQLIRPVEVIGCYVDYRIVECVQAGLQMLLSINSTCISFFLIYAFSHQKPSPDAVYGEQITGPTPLDTALPPYSRTLPNRSNGTHRSIRSVNHQSMRKQRQRSSTRSTKSHRSNVHHRNRAASVGRTHDAAIITNASSSSSSNQTTTTTINRIGATGLAGHTIELYGTYGKRRSTGHTQTADHAYQYQNQHHHTAYGSSSHLQSSMVTGATATTGDTSSLDSYAGRSNHAYHESRSSLHKEDTGSMYQSNTTYRSQPGVAQVEATSGNGQQPREMQVSQPLGSLSALSTHGRQHEAIYNIYSSNPYNTYGRSLSRPQQRPSSFCSNASSSSNNLTYAVNTNPAGGSTFYNPNRPSSRMSPIYMNSETRI